MHKITLTGQPQSTNKIYKYRCAGSVPRMYMTQKGRDLKEQYQWEAKSQWQKPPLKGNVSLDIVLYHGDKRGRDIDNYSKIVFDSLEGIVFENDNQVKEAHFIQEYDKSNPRVEIIVN